VAAAIEYQMLVHLVGDHQQIGAHREVGDRRELCVGSHHPRRVVRGVEDQRLGLRRDGAAQSVDVDGEAGAVGHHRHGHALATRHGDDGRVRVVERLDQQHFGTWLDEPITDAAMASVAPTVTSTSLSGS
jgi:hypothetical protein